MIVERADWMRWLDAARAMAAALAAKGCDVHFDAGPPLSEAQLASVEEAIAERGGTPEFRLHASLRARESVFAGLTLQWTGELGRQGRMDLADVGSLYRSTTRKRERWHGRWRVLDTIDAVTHVLVSFDAHGHETLAHRSTEGGGERFTPLALSLDDYFALSLSTCALSGWPLFFGTDADGVTLADDLDHVAELLGALQALSPPAEVRDVARRLPAQTRRRFVATWPDLASPYGLS